MLAKNKSAVMAARDQITGDVHPGFVNWNWPAREKTIRTAMISQL
jgi:hypothetical protein